MIVKIADAAETFGLRRDRRFRAWAKILRVASDVDLAAPNGYALTGPWAKWDETVAVEPGQFIVIASETGSRTHHDYDYRLIQVTPQGLKRVTANDRKALFESSQIPDEQRARAANSTLYAYALYAYLTFAQPDTLTTDNPLASISTDELIAELRRRGYKVTEL